MSDTDEILAIAIDNGTSTCKAGFAGENEPKSITDTAVGRPRYPMNKDIYIGNEATENSSLLFVKHPIEHGIVTNWDDMEKVWHHIFYNELRVAPEEHAVLLSEPSLNPKGNREKMTEIMFETFNVPSMLVATQATLTLYASGRSNGVVVNCGDGMTQIVPFSRSLSLQCGTQTFHFAGVDVTNSLIKLVSERGYVSVARDYQIIKEMKEKLCYVTQDYDKEMSKASSSLEKSYTLPDGQTITIGSERFRCTELLFQPVGYCGIQNMVCSSVTKCEPSIHADLYANIILSGGTTLIPGFANRLQKEVIALAPDGMKVKVVADPNRRLSAWIGGSILGSLSSFQQMCMCKDDYDEHGPSLIHKKCL